MIAQNILYIFVGSLKYNSKTDKHYYTIDILQHLRGNTCKNVVIAN